MIRIDGNWELITGYNGSQITTYVLGGSTSPRLLRKEDAAARYGAQCILCFFTGIEFLEFHR